MTDDTHKCPATGCMVRCSRAQLACRPHWFSLPPQLRAAISRTWRSGPLDEYMGYRAEAVRLLGGRDNQL